MEFIQTELTGIKSSDWLEHCFKYSVMLSSVNKTSRPLRIGLILPSLTLLKIVLSEHRKAVATS